METFKTFCVIFLVICVLLAILLCTGHLNFLIELIDEARGVKSSLALPALFS
jgi:hypothetical protein